ncbi:MULTISPECIES: serine protease [unclassified Bradyrhizobium]|uniref:S1 family peptidase n=1 Tax=unclassified Bradyrhizobium TaxID=2631580 RepID=UPI002916C27E|nr:MULTISPECIES: serine protease [unclassified Bradyrhizobium]
MRSVVVLLFVLFCCAPIEAEPVDRNVVWSLNKQSVVKVLVTGRDATGSPIAQRVGSGVIVRSNGVVVTALHVVGKDEDWFELPGGRRDRKVEVLSLNSNGIPQSLGIASVRAAPGIDIAILTLTASGLHEAELTDARPEELSSVVGILWDPDLNQPEPVSGDLVPTDRGRFGDLFTVRMAVVEGNSGSGLFAPNAKLAAIVTNQLGSSRALAVPTDQFQSFLPPPPPANCTMFTSGLEKKVDLHSSPTVEHEIYYFDAQKGCRITKVEHSVSAQRNFFDFASTIENEGRRAKVEFNVADRPQPSFAKIDLRLFQEPTNR